MAKRKQSKSAAGKGAKVGASNGKSTHSRRRSKLLAKVGASAAVTALFEKTRRRIKEIEKHALAKLGGKDTDQ